MSTRTDAPSALNRATSNILLQAAVFLIFISGWEGAVRFFGIPKIVLPPPSQIAVAMWESVWSGDLQWHLAVTMYEIMAGFVIGAVGGLVLGFIVALSPLMERIFYPYVVAFQTIPKVAI